MRYLPYLLLSCLLGCQKAPQPKPTPKAGTISTGWLIGPFCPQGAALCTNAEYVAIGHGKIIAYYQNGWKKPNGEPLGDPPCTKGAHSCTVAVTP